ncbi:putative resolvase [Burkholderia cepacia]|nr:putative resolvase [Burkholderia cepacia]
MGHLECGAWQQSREFTAIYGSATQNKQPGAALTGNSNTRRAGLPITKWHLMRPFHFGTRGCRPTVSVTSGKALSACSFAPSRTVGCRPAPC